jgi:5-methylcytosine-specific restriction endonuclease McrA
MPGRPKRSKDAEGATWRRIVAFVVKRDAGKCHICGHFGAYSADHVIPDTEGGSSRPDNLKAVHGYPKACLDCSRAAGKPVYCNEIRGAMSVDRARRKIEERTGLTLGTQPGAVQPEGREW